MTIRPFSFGDVFLLQHLSRHATHLHIEQTLLQARSPLWTVLRTSLPWISSSCVTYVLRQEENGLARAGLVQLEVRPNRPEAEVQLLMPALDSPEGHPAIWQKLLAQAAQQLVGRKVSRLYCDLPDQPLLVNTLKQAGFQHFTSETVWRLRMDLFKKASGDVGQVREATDADSWELTRLYEKVTPPGVQQAEGWPSLDREMTGSGAPIILASRPDHLANRLFVLEGNDSLRGAVQLSWGPKGGWLRLWANTNNPDTAALRQLLGFALSHASEMRLTPVYIGVRSYQRGIEPLLARAGFAPFTDRARMVRSIWQRIRHAAPVRVKAMEGAAEVLPGTLALHQSALHQSNATPLALPLPPGEVQQPEQPV